MSFSFFYYTYSIDPLPSFFGEWLYWQKEITLVFQGSDISAPVDLIKVCPSQSQISLDPVANGWINFIVMNGYNVQINLTVTISSPDDSTCNRQTSFALPYYGPNQKSQQIIPIKPQCNNVTLLLQLFNSQTNSLQTCWQFSGLLSTIFQTKYLTPVNVSDIPTTAATIKSSTIPTS